MEMVRLLVAFAAIPVVATAAGFSLTIGPPVAAGAGVKVTKTKAALFAVRLEECEALEKAQIGGTAEGIVEGMRTSAPLTLFDAGSPGVYVVSGTGSQGQGVWVVNLSATCGGAKAGAIVPLGGSGGFLRDEIKILPRPATKAEIDAALHALVEKPAK